MSQTQKTGGSRAESIADLPPRVKPSPNSRADLNMTSMIDVVFLLLIFFIVSVEFRTIEGLLPTNLPPQGVPAVTTAEEPLDPVRLVISNDPSSELDPERHSFTAVITCSKFKHRLPRPSECLAVGRSAKSVLTPLTLVTKGFKELIQEFGDRYRTDTPVIIQVDSDVDYGNVILVYDAVLGARMKKVSFTVKQ